MLDKIMQMSKAKRLFIFYGVLALIVGLYIFFAAPNLNPLYADGAFFWALMLTICIGVPTIFSVKLNINTDQTGRPSFNIKETIKARKIPIILIAAAWILIFLVNIIFNPLFFWGSYRDQMPEPTVKEFTSDVQAVDISQIPIVDSDLAKTLADKKLGEKPSLGSQVMIGEPTMQNVNGELVWAVPLHHSGFFKWLANMDGAAGYIKVSATNLQKVEYVEDYKIKIQPNSYFMDDLLRRVRLTGGLFTGITDYSFELDDTGRPFWIVTTYKNTCGFTLPEASGIIMVDAQTGAAQKYGMDEIPSWVDRVQPEDFILAQINNKGQYIHGIFNFSNKEKFRTSQGENIIYNNGRCYLFTGVTSVGIDESATGFWLVDMVTKEPVLYRMSGATEQSAMKSAQGKVQDLGYYATAPIILNVFETPTYFMTLKDSAKLIKKYAFVSVRDYMIVGVGDSMQEAKSDYAKAMNSMGQQGNIVVDQNQAKQTIVGTIERISFTISGDRTIYSFTLTEKPKMIFTAELSLSAKLPITREGDSVKVEYILSDEEAMDVTSFMNMTF